MGRGEGGGECNGKRSRGKGQGGRVKGEGGE